VAEFGNPEIYHAVPEDSVESLAERALESLRGGLGSSAHSAKMAQDPV
jgi:hypothetical protein